MSAKIEKLRQEKEDLNNKVRRKEEKLVDLAFDVVLGQLENENCPESEEGWFCPEMIDCTGRLIEERIPLVLEVLHEENYLERKVNMGIPHYRLTGN